MGGTYSTCDGMNNASTILFGKYDGKRPLGIHRRRWEYNIKIYLRKSVWRVWIGLVRLIIWTCVRLL